MAETTIETLSETRVKDDNVLILTPRTAFLTWAIFVSFMLLFNDVLGMINRGGIFIFIFSLQQSYLNVPSVDVDDSSLRIVFMAFTSLIIIGVAMICKSNVYDKNVSFVMLAASIGGGYLIDGFNDQKIVDRILANKGYTYCKYGDYKIGHGKGSVWFHHYVLDPRTCPPRKPWHDPDS